MHGALLERNLAAADISGGLDDAASCPRYFGSQAVRESIAGHVGSVSKTSQEVLELRRQFTGLAAAYDNDTGSDSGSDAAKESLEEGRVHRGEQGALAMLSPVHPKMQDALGEKKTLRSFLCSSRLLAGEALEAVRLEDLRLLDLEEGAGGLVLAKAGASAGKPGSHGLLGLANALGGRIGLAGGGGHDEREEAGGGGAARETPAKMKRWSRR